MTDGKQFPQRMIVSEGDNQEKNKLWKDSHCHLVRLRHETGSVVIPGTGIRPDRYLCNHFRKPFKDRSSAALQVINSIALQLPSHYWKLKDIWFFHQFKPITICPFSCGFAEEPPLCSCVLHTFKLLLLPPKCPWNAPEQSQHGLEPFSSAMTLSICGRESTTITVIMAPRRLALPH